ncbi:MAG: TonB-dependent siderophore receptor [Gemmatimonadales bacterium]
MTESIASTPVSARLAPALAGLVLLVSPALAQTPAATQPDTSAVIDFRIPSLPLAAALDSFFRQSGVRVTWRADGVARPDSRELIGRYRAGQALRRLLAGTRLEARFTGSASVTLEPAVQTLASVDVVAPPHRRSGYAPSPVLSALKTPTLLRDVPLSVTVVSRALIADQGMQGMADVVRYLPGATMGQGEGNRDQPTIRGNGTTANFFLDGVRDDLQYYRDLYNVERVEGLKGANALTFGRGAGGGVINRVAKQAGWTSVRDVSFQGGSFDNRRGTLDVGQGIGRQVALRVNGLYENSDQFRRGVTLERYGINPTLTVIPGSRTTVTLGFEHFRDRRTADRGIPSFRGVPAPTDIQTFFGDPRTSNSSAQVDIATAGIEYQSDAVTLRNRTRLADYAKFYQNVFPGAVNAAGTQVSLSAYNNGTDRRNLFNQSELVFRTATGAISHTLLAGLELGRQVTDNRRTTGYFDNDATSALAPFDQPTVSRPVTFRPSATDADHRAAATTISFYAQDELHLSSRWRLVAGVRYERFEVDFHDRRADRDLGRRDDLLSPRVGFLYYPGDRVSLYGSFGVTALPSAGDQFASLTTTSATLEPERFTNYEIGVKWDLRDDLAVTAAVYRLDRTNTTAPDPDDPAKVVQTGSQRTKGIEIGVNGQLTRSWQIAGGYANQDAVVTSRTLAASPGARVALVPEQTLSLWNRYQVVTRLGLGLGLIHQGAMFAAIDNAVTLPAFTRVDAAAFVAITGGLRGQLNLENVFNRRYFPSAHSNNNISPGSPRAFRISLTAGF